MKKARLLGLCLLGLFSIGRGSLAFADGAIEKAVAALEEQWMQALSSNDSSKVAPLLADRYIGTRGDGRVFDRSGEIADAKGSKYTSAETIESKVSVFGTTAIATGTQQIKGTDGQGKALNMRFRYTDTWIKMPDGKWQCVASHISNLST